MSDTTMHSQIGVMKVVLLVSSVASLGVLAAAAFDENFRGDWRPLQERYATLLASAASDSTAREAAAAFPVEKKQLYLEELNRIDRCTTCHLGVENPEMDGVEKPLARHPGDLLTDHLPDRFGCTICHQGRGRATTADAAHGWYKDGTPVAHIDTPILRGRAVYTSCGRCHYELDLFGGESDLFAATEQGEESAGDRIQIDETSLARTLPGAEELAEGKRLVIDLGCLGCHKYRGRGGTLGTDLTHVGDKTRHDFDFSFVRGEHTVEQWLYQHFMEPREVSPQTEMPDLGLTPKEARALSLYMMSLHKKMAPPSHTPRPPALGAVEPRAVRGETLFSMFCSSCHGTDGYGTTMRAELWPADADPWGHDWDARNVVQERRGDLDVMVPSLNHADTLSVVSDEYLRRIISYGRPGTKMLGWATEGGLSEDEITLLVGYVRAWESPPPDLASISSQRGDPRIGGALYRANCGACHGRDGEGGIGNSLNSPTFLAVASDAFLRDTIVYGRSNTAMPAWRDFSAQEISDLLAFLRQWQPTRSTVESVLALRAQGESETVSAAIGKILYKANCVMCHGADGSGDLAPSLNTQAFLTVVPDFYLASTLIEGRQGTGMPSWRHLSTEDVASLIAYLRSWQTRESRDEAWHDRTVPRGDWDAGRYLFAGSCASCHGTDGEGATGPQLNNPAFLRIASDVMLREWITHGKENTEMRPFRKGGQGITEFTERQIEDIVAYLRLLERSGETEITRVAKSPHGRPEKGARLYVNNCAACHGERGQGASGPALANREFLRFASDGFLMATMALGRLGTEMRPVKRGPQSILGLTSDEVNDLVAFLRSWEYEPPVNPDNPDAPPHRFVVPWDLARGRELYASNCEGCHGEEGKGSWAPELNNEGFLAAATDGFLQATIVRGRKGTAMRPFGRGAQGLADLEPKDIDDIVAYMRHWSSQFPSPMTLPAERSIASTDPPDESKQIATGRNEVEVRRGEIAPVQQSQMKTQDSMAAGLARAQGD